MSKSPEVRERRYKIELFELNDNFELVDKKNEDNNEPENDYPSNTDNDTSTPEDDYSLDYSSDDFVGDVNELVPDTMSDSDSGSKSVSKSVMSTSRSSSSEDPYSPGYVGGGDIDVDIEVEVEEVDEKVLDPGKDNNRRDIKNPKALCELVSFSTRFALNSIPVATVVPAIGKEIKYGGERLLYKKLQELAVNSKPVGVYLTVIHNTRSSTNKKDKQYWPEKPCCIFKGFVQQPTFEVSAYGARQNITLVHWLSALSGVSLLTTASHVGNPMETALRGYLFPDASGSVWNPVRTNIVSVDNVWEDGIKPIYLEVLNWGERFNDKYNPLVKEKRQRIRTAINKITQNIKINDFIENVHQFLRELIAYDIQSDAMVSFIGTDGWSKIISYYCPSYLMALVPQVDKATFIPVPCTVNKDKATEITLDEIFNIQCAPFLEKRVSRVTCVAAKANADNNTSMGTPDYINLGTYPSKSSQKEGINVTVSFPGWITKDPFFKLPTETEILDFFMDPVPAVNNVKVQQNVANEVRNNQSTVGQQYAQMAYLVQAYNGSFVRISMPVNMTICPGTMVKVNLDKKGETSYYGTVAEVEVSLTSGNTPLTTVLTITNIRDDVSIKDKIDNPQEKVGFFKEQWSGKGVMLYAE